MRSDIMGGVKIKPLLSGPPGYRPKDEGVKARKIVRGNSITKDIAQINAIIVR
jgi:Ribosomal protein S6E (S10)